MNDIRTRQYDAKIACIQAKRIYKKLLSFYDMEGVPHEVMNKVKDVTSSFDFFIDIIHLLDPQDEDPEEGKDIELINVYRTDCPERKAKHGIS